MRFKTYTPTTEEAGRRKWYIVDAKDAVLGRLAAKVAAILRGKHKTTFAPHADMGDYVIVINADKIRVTGDRLDTKFYYRHSLYPGGFRAVSLRRMLETHPERVVQFAIKGMLPHNRLGRQMVKKLKVYAGEKHPHGSHLPEKLDLDVKKGA